VQQEPVAANATDAGRWSQTVVLDNAGELMLRVLQDIETELSYWLPTNTKYWAALDVLASTYMGVQENVLRHLLEWQSHAAPAGGQGEGLVTQGLALHALLRAVAPYLCPLGRPATSVHAGPVLQLGVAQSTHEAPSQAPLSNKVAAYNPFAKVGGGGGVEVAWRCIAWHMAYTVSERLWLLQSGGHEALLRECLSDVTVFLAAYHSEYWSDYKHAWARIRLLDGDRGAELPINLRVSTQKYSGVVASDGVCLPPGTLRTQLRIMHSLLVVAFLGAQEARMHQADALLNFLIQSVADDVGVAAVTGVPFALHLARVQSAKSQPLAAIGTLKHALQQPARHTHAAQQADGKAGKSSGEAYVDPYWREEAYLHRCLEHTTRAAFKELGKLEEAASELSGALASYSTHLALLRTEALTCTHLELKVAGSQWRVANVKLQLAMHRCCFVCHDLCMRVP